ncbi:unnamed protein product, partial [Cyprideis torosa]
MNPFPEEYFMKQALQEAYKAFDHDEVPVGAVVRYGDRIIGRGHNLTQTLNDVTAHAEMMAITAAAEALGGKYLKGCTMYITLEPCVMCAGALFWSQIDHVVFAAPDPKRGFRASGVQLHPKTKLEHGLLEKEATDLLLLFFEELLRSEKPSHIGVCFDVGRENVRTAYYPEYKGTRDETPEPIRWGVPHIQAILEALNIPILFVEGYEADDVIGTLVQKAEKEGFETYMMTSDKDFAQLVTDNIKMYRPAAFGRGPEIWGVEEVKKKFEIEDPKQVIDFLGMMGDAVDNIPGLPGVGEKTAKKFLAQYGSMENLLANTQDLKGKMKEKVEASKELGLLSKKLATIITDVPVEFKANELLFSEPDWARVEVLFDDLEFRRLKDNAHKVYGLLGFESDNTPVEVNMPGAQTSLFAQSVGEEEGL